MGALGASAASAATGLVCASAGASASVTPKAATGKTTSGLLTMDLPA